MVLKQEQEQEKKRVKNLQEWLKRQKDYLTQGLHDYALLADAKRRLFPSASLLMPESFGVAVNQPAKIDQSNKPIEHFLDPTVEMFADG
ncbi:hypothetical protein AbraIFM66950_002177 [Aspergillus brasiliensis]|nr:hypothetical protein AbraIFM66950_002177 [Aspergillus brasiliensis]